MLLRRREMSESKFKSAESDESYRLSLFDKNLEVPFSCGLYDNRVVLLALIGIGFREICDGLIKFVALPEIPANMSRLSGSGVGM
jgi:hypothetical protein